MRLFRKTGLRPISLSFLRVLIIKSTSLFFGSLATSGLAASSSIRIGSGSLAGIRISAMANCMARLSHILLATWRETTSDESLQITARIYLRTSGWNHFIKNSPSKAATRTGVEFPSLKIVLREAKAAGGSLTVYRAERRSDCLGCNWPS
jgi:hypothetical protein